MGKSGESPSTGESCRMVTNFEPSTRAQCLFCWEDTSNSTLRENQGEVPIQVKVVVSVPFSNQLLSIGWASFPEVKPLAQYLWLLRRHFEFNSGRMSGESHCTG